MPKKYERCIKAVKKQGRKVNPYAVCHASLSKKVVKDRQGWTHPTHIDYCEMCGKTTRKKKWNVREINLCKKCMEGQKHTFNLDKSLDKESRHITKMKKKYKNHKFTREELIAYD